MPPHVNVAVAVFPSSDEERLRRVASVSVIAGKSRREKLERCVEPRSTNREISRESFGFPI